jgi:predicted nucleic acid-binding protein
MSHAGLEIVDACYYGGNPLNLIERTFELQGPEGLGAKPWPKLVGPVLSRVQDTVLDSVRMGFLHSSRTESKDTRRAKLKDLRKELVAVDISDYRIIEAYADISSVARTNVWSIFNEKNDLWIAAATRITGATLLTMDKSAFGPLSGAGELSAIILDPKSGYRT